MRKILGVLVAFFLIFTFTIQPKITEAKVSYSWNPKKEYLYSNNRIMIFTETNAKGKHGDGSLLPSSRARSMARSMGTVPCFQVPGLNHDAGTNCVVLLVFLLSQN